jgi:hypothetical protein
MSDTISGGCLCGKVTFEVLNDFQQFHLCHCAECRKITGSAHSSLLFASAKNIKWLSGAENIKQYDSPQWDLSRAFCNECGCAVPYVTKDGDVLIIPAGSLNGNPRIAPQDNIFWPERAGWYDAAISAVHFDGFPT